MGLILNDFCLIFACESKSTGCYFNGLVIALKYASHLRHWNNLSSLPSIGEQIEKAAIFSQRAYRRRGEQRCARLLIGRRPPSCRPISGRDLCGCESPRKIRSRGLWLFPLVRLGVDTDARHTSNFSVRRDKWWNLDDGKQSSIRVVKSPNLNGQSLGKHNFETKIISLTSFRGSSFLGCWPWLH